MAFLRRLPKELWEYVNEFAGNELCRTVVSAGYQHVCRNLIAYNCTGEFLAVSGFWGDITIHAMPSFQLRYRFRNPANYYPKILFHPTRRSLLVSADNSHRFYVRSWDFSEASLSAAETREQPMHTIFIGHESPIRAVTFSHDGERLFTGSNDRTLRMWDVETGHCLHKYRNRSAAISALCINNNPGINPASPQLLASADNNDFIRVRDLRTRHHDCLRVWQPQLPDQVNFFISKLLFSENTQLIAGGKRVRRQYVCGSTLRQSDGFVQVYDLRRQHRRYVQPVVQSIIGGEHKDCINGLCFNSSRTNLYTASEDALHVWQATTTTTASSPLTCIRRRLTDKVCSVSPDPRDPYRLATAHTDGTVRIYHTLAKLINL